MISKTAMITICGLPNVGKSTLTNALAGEKIAIVSNKPQTTRNRITAVCQRGETQFVFLDTPGFHKPRTRLGDYMVNVVRQSVADVDAVVLVVEPVASIGPQERELIASIKAADCPAVLAINKLDTVEPEKLLAVIALYSEAYAFNAIVPISAKTGDGVEELLKELDKFAVESPALFPEGVTTDQPEKPVCAELIREKLLLNLEREVPHGTAVEIKDTITAKEGEFQYRYPQQRVAICQLGELEYAIVEIYGKTDCSAGTTLQEMADFIAYLFPECRVAYNLDGGGSTNVVVDGERIHKTPGARKISDILYFASAWTGE